MTLTPQVFHLFEHARDRARLSGAALSASRCSRLMPLKKSRQFWNVCGFRSIRPQKTLPSCGRVVPAYSCSIWPSLSKPACRVLPRHPREIASAALFIVRAGEIGFPERRVELPAKQSRMSAWFARPRHGRSQIGAKFLDGAGGDSGPHDGKRRGRKRDLRDDRARLLQRASKSVCNPRYFAFGERSPKHTEIQPCRQRVVTELLRRFEPV